MHKTPLAVLLLSCLLAACGIAQVGPAVRQGHAELAQHYLEDVSTMIELHHLTHGRLPASLAELDVTDPATGEVLARRVADDPWRRPYAYDRLGPTTYRVYSHGPDGVPGSSDDIVVARTIAR